MSLESGIEAYFKSLGEHRKGMSDMQWANAQSQEPPNFMVGDIVEFMVGGFGIIVTVTKPHDGWPSSYAADPVPGLDYHSKGKYAWHYEGDFKRLAYPSAIRAVMLHDQALQTSPSSVPVP